MEYTGTCTKNWFHFLGCKPFCSSAGLFIAGAVPNFWDLDGGILTRFRFYLYVKERGEAWIFRQENNPFACDKWNLASNKKVFSKHGKPWRCPNFLGVE